MTLSTAEQRRLKRQRSKINKNKADKVNVEIKNALPEGVEIEYITESIIPEESFAADFTKVIARFSIIEETEESRHDETINDNNNENHVDDELDGTETENDAENLPKLSKKKAKKLSRMTLAELKHYSAHPEIVEWEDVTAKDPKLLVQIKCTRHSVPVPRHWSQKRKYLAGKRGYVKPPFDLPTFIKETGITELRETMRAQDASKRLKGY